MLVLVAWTVIKITIKPMKLFELVRFMPIELTDQPQQILDAAGDRSLTFIDPRTSLAYVLVSMGKYQKIQKILEDERREQLIRSTPGAMRSIDFNCISFL